MTDWRIVDYRKESLKQIIIGLKNSIELLEIKNKNHDWYDGLWLLEDSEPIYGLAFIAFQNYINGSIKDLYESTEHKINFYKIEGNHNNFSLSKIELIVALANYIKHKDEGKLHTNTQKTLDAFNLKNNDEITESAIFDGLSVLSNTWDLFELLDIVTKWREKLFIDFHVKNQS